MTRTPRTVIWKLRRSYADRVRGALLGSLFFLLGCNASLGARDGAPPGRDGGPDAAPSGTDGGPPRDAGPPLPCDGEFSVPSAITAGVPFDVQVTHATGFTFIGMNAVGPGSPSAAHTGTGGSGPYTWTFTISGHAAGVLTLTFTADMGMTAIAGCQVAVRPGGAGDAGVDGGVDAGSGSGPPTNRFGIGLVAPGSTAQLDLAADLTGPGGHIKMIFAGVVPGMTGPTVEWSNAVRDAYARDLVPVVRFGPPWGDRRVRNQSDPGSDGLAYTRLAASYVNVVRGLPLRAGWPFYVEVHNEPNLCYEWQCDRGRFASDQITSARIALEYASMLRDVADALHGLSDPRVRVVNAGLAPGGVRWCECNGTTEGAWEGGNTSREFLSQMSAGVAGIFARVDAFASHSYPAEGAGFGFFVPYDRAGPGLRYFESELLATGRPTLPVLMTETGWPATHAGVTYGARADVATWTRQAYENVWLTHSSIRAVMPFILQDGSWDGFAWVRGDGSPHPVYTEVRALRCASIPGRCP